MRRIAEEAGLGLATVSRILARRQDLGAPIMAILTDIGRCFSRRMAQEAMTR